MKIINKTRMCCSVCGVEASGLNEIQKVFGYKMVKEDIVPFSECRQCRGVESEEEERRKNLANARKWATAARWGRDINISRTVFDSYLIELGYLEHNARASSKRKRLAITKEGSKHSKLKTSILRKKVLWDSETNLDVMKLRVSHSIMHDVCPKCKAYLDTMPDYDPLEAKHKCKRCGSKCEYWLIKATYDR